MRVCVYCGKELEPDEKCNCPGAVKRRGEKEKNSGKADSNGSNASNGYYRTGYTEKVSKSKRRWNRFKAKCQAAKNQRRAKKRLDKNQIFSYMLNFLKAPVDAIRNPRGFTVLQMFIIAAVQGGIIGLGIYFASSGASRSWFRAVANIIGFGGITGYKAILCVLYAVFAGAVGAAAIFAMYTGVFWLLNRLIMRDAKSGFADIGQRLVMTTLPGTIIAAVGVLFSFFSSTTLMILLLCGAASAVILTFVSLEEQWYGHSSSRVLYTMMLGYFIMFTIILSLIRVGMIR